MSPAHGHMCLVTLTRPLAGQKGVKAGASLKTPTAGRRLSPQCAICVTSPFVLAAMRGHSRDREPENVFMSSRQVNSSLWWCNHGDKSSPLKGCERPFTPAEAQSGGADVFSPFE
ncbi:hypothetical protein SKAU_G00272590 [Synaphobranchus kaupii]|uniref:Uncharacterized protein n=1 Tax=Synaphobranchus kaupii TaxID=118154 RepID=A0A9Q1F0L0_SYNKA|nr:hypothetical protein SKAU_G00272590 [Synaphobranchus kaupii]